MSGVVPSVGSLRGPRVDCDESASSMEGERCHELYTFVGWVVESSEGRYEVACCMSVQVACVVLRHVLIAIPTCSKGVYTCTAAVLDYVGPR